jgi:1,2-phenylacetyl-CoA epoxidase PaaB subunit
MSLPETGQVYEVFARGKLSEPLTHVGSLRAPDERLARAYARTTYDEERWAEMVAVPRDAVIHVVEPKTGR